MDLEIKHLGQTLAIGGFAIYGIFYLVKVCRAAWVPKFIYSSNERLQIQQAAVYLALLFAAGILLEDVSKNYAAKRSSLLYPVLAYVLDTDNELRLRSLYVVEDLTKDRAVLKPRPLVLELSKITPPPHSAVEPHFKTISAELVKIGSDGRLTIVGAKEVENFLGALNGIYYDAKNHVFKYPTYFAELSAIEDRTNFSRALTFLCVVYGFLYAVFAILGFVPRVAAFLDIDPSERKKLMALAILYCLGVGFEVAPGNRASS